MLKYGPVILAVLALTLTGLASGADQTRWRLAGPFGGNARVLAYDPSYPDHILLGSGGGAVFESLDNGTHWRPLAQLGAGHDLMLQSIAFHPSDPQTIYAAGWSITGSGGGFFVTRDGGRSWTEPEALRGKSVQALAVAQGDPQTLVAGALDGLYRSQDGGKSWERITPLGDPDLKNFESVAIDPRDAQVIYAGTWHLPWKTTDGGLHWSSIKQGVIDDSDVFSIILDHQNPATVFASACSGIYKSDDGGQLFRKVEGIPGSARRTRVLRQDPADANTLYAGTTEGLWKSTDGGQDFKLISPPDFILNGVLVDPRDSRRLLIATDRGGVFASDDGGQTFHASNEGFSQRQITAVVADPQEPSDLFVSVLNDKEFGGVFHRHEGRWMQLNQGLGQGLDQGLGQGPGTVEVLDLQRSPAGQLVAATNHGLFVFETSSQRWKPSRVLLIERKVAGSGESKRRASQPKVSHSKAASGRKAASPSSKAKSVRPWANLIARSTFEGRATALAIGDRRWYAATAGGVLMSGNQGGSWSGAAVDGASLGEARDLYSVAAHGRTVAVATLRQVWVSSDEGSHWRLQPLPSWVTRVYGVAIVRATIEGVTAGESAMGEDELWVATREGALRWWRNPAGIGEWQRVLNGLPAREVISIRNEGGWLLAGAAASDTVYVSRDQGQSWLAEPDAGFEVTGAVKQDEQVYLLTRQHGVLELDPGPATVDARPEEIGRGSEGTR